MRVDSSESREGWPSLLATAVLLTAAHTISIGVMLIAAPEKFLRIFGCELSCSAFFWHQVGVFHCVIGTVFLTEYSTRREVRTLLLTKAAAAIFLSVEYFWFVREAWVLLALAIDTIIGVGVGWLAWRTPMHLRCVNVPLPGGNKRRSLRER